jgi:ribosome-associated toxin RatA of RatAB toxin-antitoxin module
MKKIISSDSIELNFSLEIVFEAVSDVTCYAKWWSKNVKVKVLENTANRIGSKVEIHASGGRFRCEIESLEPFREVRIRYYDGVQRGEGIWKIEKLSEKKSILNYSVDLEPVGFLPKFLSRFINFSEIHSNLMMEMFKSLEKYLKSL